MVIYIDLVIIATLLINYIFIKSINILFNSKTSFIRTMVATLLSVVALLFYLLPYPFLWNLRHLYGILIGLVAFKDKNKSRLIVKIITFYVMNYLLIGTLAVFNIHSIINLIIVSLIIVIIFFIEYFLKFKVTKMSYSTNYNYSLENKILKTLVDTGNKCYYQGLMVAFLDIKFLDQKFVRIGEMLTKSVLGEVLVDIYIGPPLMCKNEELITYFAFMKIDNYDLIIGVGEEND